MTAKDLVVAFNLVLSQFLIWLDCIRNPNETGQKILESSISSNAKIRRALQVWLIVFVLSLILLLPVYHAFGIEFGDIGFHLAHFTAHLMFFMLVVAVIHAGLVALNHPSNFADTLVMYTVAVGSFSPFITLAEYPFAIKAFAAFQLIKKQDSSVEVKAVELLKRLSPGEQLTLMDVYSGLLVPAAGLFFIILFVIFSNRISKAYETEKHKTFLAVSFGIVVLYPIPLAISSLFFYFLIYVFVR